MNGVQDIRISIGLFTNLKVQHLRKKLGADGVLSLIQLWCYAGMHRADGMLTGMRPACVELAAGWTGACGSLCDTLLDLGLLDLNKDTFYIHDWSENQPWAANKQKRTDSAKLAAAERWKSKNAGRMRSACGPQSNRNAPSPIPIPIPIPIPKHTEAGCAPLPPLSDEVTSAWNNLGKPFSEVRMTDKRKRTIENRLCNSFWVENWRKALDLVKASAFCSGKNDRGWVADIDWFIRPDTVTKLTEGKYGNKEDPIMAGCPFDDDENRRIYRAMHAQSGA